MVELNFPISPTLGQIYTPNNNNSYYWDTVKWVALRGESGVGTFGPQVILRHELAANVAGGTAAAGAWTDRILNVIHLDNSTLLTAFNAGTGEFTLAPGTIEIFMLQNFKRTGRTLTRLYDVDGASAVLYGLGRWLHTSTLYGNGDRVALEGRFTIASATKFTAQWRTESTRATYGLGTAGGAVGQSFNVHSEVYLRWL